MVHDKEEDVPMLDEWKTLLMQDFLALKQLKGLDAHTTHGMRNEFYHIVKRLLTVLHHSPVSIRQRYF